MILTTFAHKGEAFHFLNHLPEDHLLCITGEGFFEPMMKVSQLCTLYHDKIKKIINFGISGDLSQNLDKHAIYPIRTVYGQKNSEELYFKSFTLSSSELSNSKDCVSAIDRVLQPNHFLSHFAPIVDRELWAIAQTAHHFKVPLEAYKLISDFPNHENFNCNLIQDSAPLYSEKLWDYFSHHLKTSIPLKNEFSVDEIIPFSFHATTSQKQKLRSLIHSLSLKLNKTKSEIVKSLPFDEIVKKEIHPKKRTEALIHFLETHLNPYSETFKKKLEQILSSFTDDHCELKFENHFENSDFVLSKKIQSEKDLIKLKEAIDQFPYSQYKKLLEGNWDE